VVWVESQIATQEATEVTQLSLGLEGANKMETCVGRRVGRSEDDGLEGIMRGMEGDVAGEWTASNAMKEEL
jgi:hypothetical protein